MWRFRGRPTRNQGELTLATGAAALADLPRAVTLSVEEDRPHAIMRTTSKCCWQDTALAILSEGGTAPPADPARPRPWLCVHSSPVPSPVHGQPRKFCSRSCKGQLGAPASQCAGALSILRRISVHYRRTTALLVLLTRSARAKLIAPRLGSCPLKWAFRTRRANAIAPRLGEVLVQKRHACCGAHQELLASSLNSSAIRLTAGSYCGSPLPRTSKGTKTRKSAP